jgi:phosphoribosyl 1,2-cyclic phosphodiesterase
LDWCWCSTHSKQGGIALQLRFWGVRGSIPTPVPGYLKYGGNTTCIEIRAGEDILIIDAGTGVRELGGCLQAEFGFPCIELRFLMTHFHWDHVQGLPYFAPIYSPGTEITFYSSQSPEKLQVILEAQMKAPYYPIELLDTPSLKGYRELGPEPLHALGTTVHPFPLNHPQGATGYRVESNGTVITHASDLEHGNKDLDKTLREYAQNADVLIYDAQYTPEEYISHKGWGHSTWLEATRVARECNVKRLILFHHDPRHDDECMDMILRDARKHFENTDIAREGWEIAL